MTAFRLIAIAAVAAIAALWWALMPPRPAPDTGPPRAASQQLQCSTGSDLVDKLCVCPKGSSVVAGTCAPGAPQPDTRHVTTVDLRRR